MRQSPQQLSWAGSRQWCNGTSGPRRNGERQGGIRCNSPHMQCSTLLLHTDNAPAATALWANAAPQTTSCSPQAPSSASSPACCNHRELPPCRAAPRPDHLPKTHAPSFASSSARCVAEYTALMKAARTPAFSSSCTPAMVVPAGATKQPHHIARDVANKPFGPMPAL